MSDGQVFGDAALAYFSAHGIDPALAAEIGVREQSGELHFPCRDADGPFTRIRPLSGPAKVRQPRGRPLCCWWPAGRPDEPETVLVAEGEGDALAALTAIRSANGHAAVAAILEELHVVAVPGASFPAERLADELAGVRRVLLAPDGDAAGETFASKAAAALSAAGIETVRIRQPEGTDLADCIAASDDPAGWLANAIADAEAEIAEQAVADVAPSSTDEPAAPTVRFLSPAELLASEPAEPAWCWQGYLVGGGLTLLAGKPKAGKSTLALALAHAVADGAHDFLGRAIKGGPVVYISEEGAATLAHKVAGDRLRIATRESAWPRPDWPSLVDAARHEAVRAGAALVVIDTFAFWGGLGPDSEKDAGAINVAMAPLVALAREGFAVLLVAHARKGGGEDGEAIRGSSALAGSADILLELERVGAGSPRQRKVLALSRYPQTPGVLVVEHDPRAGGWSIIGEGTDRGDAGDISSRAKLLGALSHEQDSTRADLEAAIGNPQEWDKTLKQLVDAGEVDRSGAGKKGDPYRYRKLCEDSPTETHRNALTGDAANAVLRKEQQQHHRDEGFCGAAAPQLSSDDPDLDYLEAIAAEHEAEVG